MSKKSQKNFLLEERHKCPKNPKKIFFWGGHINVQKIPKKFSFGVTRRHRHTPSRGGIRG